MQQRRRLFAVVPAAGESRRMGRPKLLLPLGEKTVIARLLDVLNHADVTETFLVIRPDDAPLRDEATATAATIVQPSVAPPEMRDSVQCALNEIRQQHSPLADDGWMLIPADHPLLEPSVLDLLIERWVHHAHLILVPTFGNRRGHPAFFRWELAEKVATIPPDRGLNWLLESHERQIVEVPVDDPAVLTDLDTPEDYQSLVRRWGQT